MLKMFQGWRRAHPDALLRRLPAQERDRQAAVEAGDLRRAADSHAQAQRLLGLCHRRLGRRLGRHHEQGAGQLHQGEARILVSHLRGHGVGRGERKRKRESGQGTGTFKETQFE